MASSTEPASGNRAQQVMELERQYVLQTYARYPIVLHRGKGCYVYDVNGKRYLDLIAGIGVNALGYGHPRIQRALREQAALLIHTSNLWYHEYQGPLAERLARISGLKRTFFCNSGTEAIEGALKMIRAHGRRIDPGKIEIVSLENSFHGRTFGALSVTGQARYRDDFQPLVEGVKFVASNDMAALEAAVSGRTAGIVLEWIQGEGGVYPLDIEYVRKARALADRHNALLVFDEIQCGIGRPGRYFAYQLADPVILPDVTVAAKPLGLGIPIGAIIANEKAAAAIRPGMHGSTFGGNALACRVALEFLDILDEMLPAIHRLGGHMRMQLAEMAHHHTFIKEVRGYGLMIGVELDVPAKKIVADGLEEGLLMNCTHETVLRFLPPYVISEQEIDRTVHILNGLLKKAG